MTCYGNLGYVYIKYSFHFSFLRWSVTESIITEASTGLLHQPRITDDDECGAISGILGRGIRSTRRKFATVPLFPPQIPYGLAQARTRAAAVAIQRPAAHATAWPKCSLYRISELMRVTFYSIFKHRPCQY